MIPQKHRLLIAMISMSILVLFFVSRPRASNIDLTDEWIVFYCGVPDYDGRSSIYTIRPNGTDLTKVIGDNSITATHPTWSPDGKWIAFTTSTAIQRLNAKTGNLLPVIGGGNIHSFPTWSPNSQQLAFVSNVDHSRGQGRDIYKVDIDGENLQRITNLNSNGIGFIDWSPDGKSIVFEREYDIYTIHSDGTDLQSLFMSTAHAVQPTWSPDGKRIAFVLREGVGESDIHILDTSTATLTTITVALDLEYYSSPNWSPDGEWIVFSATSDYGHIHSNIYKIQIDSLDAIQLTNMTDCDASIPSWSQSMNQES